jgi:hypothetical protein
LYFCHTASETLMGKHERELPTAVLMSAPCVAAGAGA